jgi:hypothetical protein
VKPVGVPGAFCVVVVAPLPLPDPVVAVAVALAAGAAVDAADVGVVVAATDACVDGDPCVPLLPVASTPACFEVDEL